MKSAARSFVVALTIVAIVCGVKSQTTESIDASSAAATTTTPTTTSPTTKSPTTKSPTTKSPTTKSPTTKSPTTKSPTPTTTMMPPPTLPPFKLCQKDISDCTCRTNNYELDLSPLANKEGDLPRFIRIRVDNSTAPLPNFAWNPCYPFEISTDAVANRCTVNNDVAVCQNSSVDNGYGFINIGRQASSNFTYRFETEDYYLNYYEGDEGRHTQIILTCNPDIKNEDSTLTFTGEDVDMKRYNFLLESPSACVKKISLLPKGFSGGSLTLIIFFSLLGAYILFGMIINTVRGKKGMEVVPNHGTWSVIFGSIKDGCHCLFTCGRNKGEYQQF